MNGVELLKRVKRMAPAIRRLMLTDNSDIETAVAAINEGQVMRFLRKPCDAATLRAALALDDYEFQSTPSSTLEARQSERAREAFLEMMDSELRAPLGRIASFAGRLERGDGAGDVAEIAERMRCDAERLLGEITRIREFCRLRSVRPGGAPIHFTEIIAILRDEIERARPAAAGKCVTLSMDESVGSAHVVGDSGDLRTAFREILSNAIRFNSPNGHVSILVRADEASIAVRFLDTGPGLSIDEIRRTAAPFAMSGAAGSRRNFAGIGLGLAIVAAIADANEARFRLDPKPAVGTAATLTFVRKRTLAAA